MQVKENTHENNNITPKRKYKEKEEKSEHLYT